jgi:hypothetical protein
MKKTKLLLLFVIPMLMSSCATSGLFTSAHITNVELSEPNYTIVARSVSGVAESSYLLGFSAAVRGEMQSFAVYQLNGPDYLYQAALENLWDSYERQNNAQVNGRSLALVNVRYDSEAVNILGFYTKAQVSLSADIVEFLE